MATPVIAIFDVGKTNKKLFLIDRSYKIVFEKTVRLEEITDSDGDPCEDVDRLRQFIVEGMREVLSKSEFSVKAANCTAYGASLVNIDVAGNPIGHLYNYLKPYPKELQRQFYETHGGKHALSFQTASPALGSLNSGLQLYRIKHERPDRFAKIHYSLHLPQYLSYLLSGKAFSEITSIGCHTLLWDFRNMEYHSWVAREGIAAKLPELAPSDLVTDSPMPDQHHVVGVGLHDSSSALIPYLVSFQEPFALISTGTWAITLNPFNVSPLTREELECDCLCYLQYRGTPVKASRLFVGHHHDVQVKRIAEHFNQDERRYHKLPFDRKVLGRIDFSFDIAASPQKLLESLRFETRDLSAFPDDVHAYHQLMYDLMVQQFVSTQLIVRGTGVRKIFVDGGFSNNEIYMNLLAKFFPEKEVYASSVHQATALGAALTIHDAWNSNEIPGNLVECRRYSAANL